MFRELWFGVGMFCFAMVGALIGIAWFMPTTSHGPEENAAVLVQGSIVGSIIGTVAWLAYRYSKSPSKVS